MGISKEHDEKQIPQPLTYESVALLRAGSGIFFSLNSTLKLQLEFISALEDAEDIDDASRGIDAQLFERANLVVRDIESLVIWSDGRLEQNGATHLSARQLLDTLEAVDYRRVYVESNDEPIRDQQAAYARRVFAPYVDALREHVAVRA